MLAPKGGADIIMAFDECTPILPRKRGAAQFAPHPKWTRGALKWLDENLPLHGYEQAFFELSRGICPQFRKQALEELIPFDLPGYALGGLSVGEPNEIMYEVTDHCTIICPRKSAMSWVWNPVICLN